MAAGEALKTEMHREHVETRAAPFRVDFPMIRTAAQIRAARDFWPVPTPSRCGHPVLPIGTLLRVEARCCWQLHQASTLSALVLRGSRASVGGAPPSAARWQLDPGSCPNAVAGRSVVATSGTCRAVEELEASRLAPLRAEADGRRDRAAELRQVISAIERDIRRLDRCLAQLTIAPTIVAGPHN